MKWIVISIFKYHVHSPLLRNSFVDYKYKHYRTVGIAHIHGPRPQLPVSRVATTISVTTLNNSCCFMHSECCNEVFLNTTNYCVYQHERSINYINVKKFTLLRFNTIWSVISFSLPRWHSRYTAILQGLLQGGQELSLHHTQYIHHSNQHPVVSAPA